MVSAVCSFATVEDAVVTSIQTLQYNIPIARIELLDEISIKACNAYNKQSMKESPTLFLEFHGSPSHVKEQAKAVEEIATSNGGEGFQWAEDAEERNRLWKARHSLYYACKAMSPGSKIVPTDVCVPISNLPRLVSDTKKIMEKAGVVSAMFGHVGDGNFHTTLLFDPNDTADLNQMEFVAHEIAMRALELDGTCTGEHGVGMGKKKLIKQQYGPDAMDVMRQIKRALDPKGIMNPGKVLDL